MLRIQITDFFLWLLEEIQVFAKIFADDLPMKFINKFGDASNVGWCWFLRNELTLNAKRTRVVMFNIR